MNIATHLCIVNKKIKRNANNRSMASDHAHDEHSGET